jgi:hypothetical protein
MPDTVFFITLNGVLCREDLMGIDWRDFISSSVFFFFFFGFENAIRPLKQLSFALPMDLVPTDTRELLGLPVMVGSGCQHMDGGVDKMQCKYMCFGG